MGVSVGRIDCGDCLFFFFFFALGVSLALVLVSLNSFLVVPQFLSLTCLVLAPLPVSCWFRNSTKDIGASPYVSRPSSLFKLTFEISHDLFSCWALLFVVLLVSSSSFFLVHHPRSLLFVLNLSPWSFLSMLLFWTVF